MRRCDYCKITVGGNAKKCPLCQNRMSGDSTESIWPEQNYLRKQSIRFKLQLFLMLVMLVCCVSVDFLFELNAGIHWSLFVVMWIIGFEITLRYIFKHGRGISGHMTYSVYMLLLLLFVTGYFTRLRYIVIGWVIPIIVTVTLLVNFILTLTRATENAMVYFLTNLLIGILPYVALVLLQRRITVPWILSLMISVIAFIGIVVFRGGALKSELEKRMNV